MVEAKGVKKVAKCYVKIYFGSGKRAVLDFRQAWWGQRRQGRR